MRKPKRVRKASQHAAMAMKGEGGAVLKNEERLKKPKARKSPAYQALVQEFGSKHGANYQKASMHDSINDFADKWDSKYKARKKRRRRSPAPFGDARRFHS